MSTLPPELLREAQHLFHDVRPEGVDADAHRAFVISRVLDRGTMSSVAALVQFYGEDGLRAFFRGGGGSRVTPSTRRLWQLYLGLTDEECTPRSSIDRSSTSWQY